MFQGFQYLAAAGQQDLAIPSVQIRENLRFALASLVGRGRCSYLRVQFEPGRLQHFFEKLARAAAAASRSNFPSFTKSLLMRRPPDVFGPLRSARRAYFFARVGLTG